MPSRNIEKLYLGGAYYHVYNRGVEKRMIFLDESDYAVFLNLLKRYLSKNPEKDKKGRILRTYYNEVELISFCLMPNHYHLLIYQHDEKAMTKLIRGVATSYTGYFNQKYGRVGHLFQNRFKASLITSDSYLHHISRYIHLNPKLYKSWHYSSLPYFLGRAEAEWVKPDRIMELFDNDPKKYKEFVEDYEDYKLMLELVKEELANY